jgi:hypothetical protein
MSNTNYKLICKYAGDFPMTVGEEYPFENVSGGIRVKLNDGGYFLFYNIGTYRHHKYFDLVPVDAAPDILPELQKEFEAIGYASWINADVYPNGKIYTREYTEWLERQVMALRQKAASDFLDETPDPIMVQPADYIDHKLLEAYNALDENGKAIMREKMPDVKWPKPVRYVTREEYSDYDHDVFGVEQSKLSDPITSISHPTNTPPKSTAGRYGLG